MVVLYWFFLFQQKTEDEMRISDWSSDVCSSDLAEPARGADYPAGDFAAVGDEDLVEHALPLLLSPPRQGEGWVGMGFAWPRSAARKIGRASCRDRVCQYV